MALEVGFSLVEPFRALLSFRPHYDGTLRDVSVTGMQLHTAARVAAGTHVKLWVKLPANRGRNRLTLTGTVMWSDFDEKTETCRIGIRVHRFPRGHARRWATLVMEQLRRFEA